MRVKETREVCAFWLADSSRVLRWLRVCWMRGSRRFMVAVVKQKEKEKEDGEVEVEVEVI